MVSKSLLRGLWMRFRLSKLYASLEFGGFPTNLLVTVFTLVTQFPGIHIAI